MKKVLFLSLGTGPIVDNDSNKSRMDMIEDAIKTQKFAYRKTTYLLNEKKIDSEFVAGPLAMLDKPDFIYVLGTVKSCWTSFYTKYANEIRREDVYSLDEIEFKGGITDDFDYINNAEEIINDIYTRSINKKLVGDEISADFRIKVVLLRYGIDNEQLEQNYTILSNVWKDFDIKEQYSVSFDITHSFRSMPIYNLTLIDYKKMVAGYNITIDHVYYGNIDVKRELEYAPIVDMVDLIRVMDLSKAIAEFKNVGYSMSLLVQVPNSQKELKQNLEDFYWAVQINDIMMISKSVYNIFKMPDYSTDNRYTDLVSMVKKAFLDILGEKTIEDVDIRNPYKVWKLGFEIAQWHYKKNRYSDAALAGFEALNSFIVPFYIEDDKRCNPQSIKLEECSDYDNRQKAYNQLKNRKKICEISGMENLVILAEKIRNDRNQIAHFSLDEDIRTSVNDIKLDLEKYFDVLTIISEWTQEQLEEFRKKYKIRSESKKQTDEVEIMDKNLAILICENMEDANVNDKISELKKAYIVKGVGKEVLDELRIKNSTNTFWTSNALTLSKYLLKEMEIDPKTKVIISFKDTEKAFFYAMILGSQGMYNVAYIKNKKEIAVPMSRNKYDMRIIIKPLGGIETTCGENAAKLADYPLIVL